jgi:MOSC domain-containing protein YiiM
MMTAMTLIRVAGLYTSRGHNFFGQHGKAAGSHELIEREEIVCVAGRGIEGDRFFDHKENHSGQITFFSAEVFEDVCSQLGVTGKHPRLTRRNVITSGVDLNSLIGEEFTVQGVRFYGVEECRPCYWMDQAIAPGAEAALRNRGGLRAKILATGLLRIDA